MSTLDQAFIRAYQKRRVIPAPHVAFPPASETLDVRPAPPSRLAPVAIEQAKPPENSVSTAAPAAISPAALPQLKAVRAALEVEQFDWPETVEALRSSSDYFAAWGEQFSGERSFTILTASGARGVGRTTALLAAARHLSLSRPAAKIALVDADFRRPQLSSRLGVAVEIGWEDVFSGEQPLAEALVESNADRVTLLPLRGELEVSQFFACAGRLGESLHALQQSFDFVCIDAGPLTEASDAVERELLGRAAKIDAALVVRDMRQAGDADNSAIGRRLAEMGVWHWDLVENFVQGRG